MEDILSAEQDLLLPGAMGEDIEEELRKGEVSVKPAAPEHVPSLTLAGIAELNTGALGEAESHLRQAVFNESHALGAKRLLATTHLRMGKTDVALSEVHELLKVSQDPSTLALAGEAYLASGDAAAAARHYELAKALASGSSASPPASRSGRSASSRRLPPPTRRTTRPISP